ncbi:hypothetical protein AAZV13_12G086850 [Glycine max]
MQTSWPIMSKNCKLNSYIADLHGVKCGIYGANSAEWIMSMQVHFIFEFASLVCSPFFSFCRMEKAEIIFVQQPRENLNSGVYCLTQKISSEGFLKKTLFNFAYS